MAWTITVTGGAVNMTLSSKMGFSLSAKKNTNGRGEVESVDIVVGVDGYLVDPSPAVIGADLFTYLGNVVDEHAAVNVLIKQDGVTRREFKPEEGFIGPHLLGFESLGQEDGGTGESQWRYAFTIVFKSKGDQSEGDDPTYDLKHSLSVTTKNGQIVRKVWKAEASSTSSASAMASVKSVRPSEKFITRELEEFFTEARATGVWVWDAEAKGVLAWRCNIRVRGGRTGFKEVRRPGLKRDAVLYPKMRGALQIEIRGTIVTFDPEIAAPPAHFTESGTLFRATEREDPWEEAEVHDEKRGEYILHYHESWDSVGPTPAANHSNNHNLIDVGRAPADGAIAG